LACFSVGARQVDGVVAGLESLTGPDTLAEMCRVVGPDRLVFSLDLKQGVPLISSPAWGELNARQIATLALRAGVRRIIVLDLASVGMDAGVTIGPLCRLLGALASDVQIVAGGGVRDRSDLRVLAAAGCDAALVASALHDGRLSAVECALLR
jgi:phosphoribosylformimino-5-aminoimidazole carboxamide ribotide isomerase